MQKSKSANIINILLIMLCILCFCCGTTALIQHTVAATYAADTTYKNTFQLNIDFIDVNGNNKSCGVRVNTNSNYGYLTMDEIGDYVRLSGFLGTDKVSCGKIIGIYGSTDDFNTMFRPYSGVYRRNTLTGAYCYKQDNNGDLKIGYYGQFKTIYFSTWAGHSDGRIFIAYKDFFGIDWVSGDGSTGTKGRNLGKFNSDGSVTTKGATTKAEIGQSSYQDKHIDLNDLATFVNNGNDYSGCTFTLTEDMTFGRTPIGYASSGENIKFSGTFDGGGYKISNAHFYTLTDTYKGLYGSNDKSCAAGLFGYLSSAVIENVWLDNVKIELYSQEKPENSGWGTTDNVGCLAGYADGITTISNCKVTNSQIKSIDDYANQSCSAGGLIGVVNGNHDNGDYVEINNVYVECDIEVRKDLWGSFVNAGGVVGMVDEGKTYLTVYNTFYKGKLTIKDENDGQSSKVNASGGGILGSGFQMPRGGDCALDGIYINNCVSWIDANSYITGSDNTLKTFNPIWGGGCRTEKQGIFQTIVKIRDYANSSYNIANNYYINDATFYTNFTDALKGCTAKTAEQLGYGSK